MKELGKLVIVSILSLASGLGLGAQAYGEQGPAAARSAVEQVFATYVKGVESFDAELWLTTWDQDGVKFTQGVPPIVGKGAIAAFVRPRFSAFESRKMTLRIDAVDIVGDLALARGTYLSVDRLKGASADSTTDGWFFTTFRRQTDGSWKIFRDCVASELSPK